MMEFLILINILSQLFEDYMETRTAIKRYIC